MEAAAEIHREKPHMAHQIDLGRRTRFEHKSSRNAAAVRRHDAERVSGKRDPARTRERILAHATDEFARHGYGGARVDRIVQRAGISKNLLYHHFSGKEELFVGVMEMNYELMRRHHHDLRIADLDPVEAMEKLVRYTFQHFIEYPEIISLLNTENLYKAKHIAKSKKIKTLYHPLVDTIRMQLQRGQAQGRFRAGVDPVDLFISISGLGYFYLCCRYTLGTIFQTKLTTPQRLRQRLDHMVEVIVGYLCHKPEQMKRASPARKLLDGHFKDAAAISPPRTARP